MNAVTLLKSDHRKLEALFDRYRSASTGKSGIVLEITRQLSMHMDAEEREVYPVLRKSISDEREPTTRPKKKRRPVAKRTRSAITSRRTKRSTKSRKVKKRAVSRARS